MGKKGRRARHQVRNPASTSAHRQTSIHQAMKQHSQNFLRKGDMETFAKMAELDYMSFEQQTSTIRSALVSMGTNCDANDDDPMGNGDQSRIATDVQREAARELFAMGGDMEIHFREQKLFPFCFMCVTGQGDAVRKMLEEETSRLKQPWSQSQTLKALLDTRVTSLRMSPLLLMVSLGKNIVLPGEPSPLLAIAKLLLEYGATPNVQDVLGKTVCHYGAGAMANKMSLDLSDMCIEAAKTVYLYGKEVELKGLNLDDDHASLENGMTGIVGGYRYDSAERSVYLTEQKKQIWINPKHLRLVERNGSTEKGVKLVDVQDRMGATSLSEVIMQDRVDVATFLLKRHKTSIHIEDMDGMSPLKMSIGGGMIMSSVCKMVNEVNQGEAGARRKAKRDSQLKCAQCMKKLNTDALQCSKCKTVSYCGRECQIAHWQGGHKKECSILSKAKCGVRLSPPKDTGLHTRILSHAFKEQTAGTYRKPNGVDFDELFVLKIQANSNISPIMIYDQTRSCQFTLYPGEPGFLEVFTETKKEKTWDGRKTYMKASFDEKSGNCTIFPYTAQVKTKYNW